MFATVAAATPTLTTFTLSNGTTGVITGTFSTGAVTLSTTVNLAGTGYTYNYASQSFTPTATGSYTFGMSSAPVDTVLILYSGSYNPASPTTNVVALNDDSDGTGAGGVTMGVCGTLAVRCPKMTLNLTGSTNYYVVVTTYSSGQPVTLPIGFYVYGEPVSVGGVPLPPVLSVLGSSTAMTNSPVYGGARIIDNTPGLLALFTGAGVTGDHQISNAATQTMPLLLGGSQIAAGSALTGINRVIQARIEANRGLSSGEEFAGDRNFWMKPFGSWADQNDRNGVSGFKANTAGIAFGADAVISPQTRLGISLAYAKAGVDGNSSVAPNSADVTVYQLVGYGSRSLSEDTELNFQVGIGQNTNNGKRQLLAFGTTASSDYKSQTYTAGIGLGKVYKLSESASFTPSVRADYTLIRDEGYTETGAGLLNLTVKGRKTDELILAVDGKYSRKLDSGNTLSANLGLGYDALNKQASITAAYAGAAAAAFTTQGIDPSPWLVRGGLGLSGTAYGGTEITARYDAEYRKDFLNQTASVKLRWSF